MRTRIYTLFERGHFNTTTQEAIGRRLLANKQRLICGILDTRVNPALRLWKFWRNPQKCKRFGVLLQKRVSSLFFVLFLPSHPVNESQAKWITSPTLCAKNQLKTCYKRLATDTTGLLSSDWSKITFIFCIGSVVRLSVINVWLICQY